MNDYMVYMKKLLWIWLLLSLFLLLAFSTHSDAGNISIQFSGSAILFWDPPTTNADGSPLTDLSGYKVYYGISSRNYSHNIDVGNVETYGVSNLTSETYYFAVTAYDTSANESDYSNEVSKATVSGNGNVTLRGNGVIILQ